MFEKIRTKCFLTFIKNINLQTQKAQQTLSMTYTKKTTLPVKFLKTAENEKILVKLQKRRKHCIQRESTIRMMTTFFPEMTEARRQ